MKMKLLQDQLNNGVPINGLRRTTFLRRSANFGEYGLASNIADNWHRNLTGRQAPEPVSQRLKMIYGRVISEKLPQDMLDLLSQLETKSSEN